MMAEVKTSVGQRQAHFTVEPEEEGARLDLFLTGKEPGLSRAQIQRAVAEGRVTVNGRPARAGRRVKAGDALALCIPAPRPSEVLPEEIPLQILYEDPFILVVDKPAGMVVHPAAGHQDGTLVNALLHHCRDLSGIAAPAPILSTVLTEPPGFCGQIRRGPPGLAGQFKRHEVAKTYQAIVCIRMGPDRGARGRHPTDRKRCPQRAAGGRGRDRLARLTALLPCWMWISKRAGPIRSGST